MRAPALNVQAANAAQDAAHKVAMFPVVRSPRQHRYQQQPHDQARSTATSIADGPIAAPEQRKQLSTAPPSAAVQHNGPAAQRGTRLASEAEQGDAVLLGTQYLPAAPFSSQLQQLPPVPTQAELRQSAMAAVGPLLASVKAGLSALAAAAAGTGGAEHASGAAAAEVAALQEALLQALIDKQVGAVPIARCSDCCFAAWRACLAARLLHNGMWPVPVHSEHATPAAPYRLWNTSWPTAAGRCSCCGRSCRRRASSRRQSWSAPCRRCSSRCCRCRGSTSRRWTSWPGLARAATRWGGILVRQP